MLIVIYELIDNNKSKLIMTGIEQEKRAKLDHPSNNGESNEFDQLVVSKDPLHPANLIPELCRLFYTIGWVTGTGGGISIRRG